MSKSDGRPLSIAQAAKIIFHTDSPTDQHIGRVYQRMKAGAIRVHDRARAPRDWTTTERAVADFLASESMRHTHPHSARQRPSQGSSAANHNAIGRPVMSGVYRSILTEYFLALMLRQRMHHRSLAFRRAVVAGQVLLLSASLAIIVSTIRWASVPSAPERIAVEKHLRLNNDRCWITRWYPSQPSADDHSVLVEVEYRYTHDSPRVISTRRQFQYDGHTVREVTEAD